MHCHLLGLDSPPPDSIPDPLTLGLVLPEGWDGDAWTDPTEKSYFLRAWNTASAHIAYGQGQTYEDARLALLQDIRPGTKRVECSLRED